MPRKYLSQFVKSNGRDTPPRELRDNLARSSHPLASQEFEYCSQSRSLLADPKYSDLTVTCGEKEFHVHKCLVCPRSAFFDRACNGRFVVGDTRNIKLNVANLLPGSPQEASSGVIKLQEDPMFVTQMIRYFYTQDYQIDPEFDASGENLINSIAGRLYTTAHPIPETDTRKPDYRDSIAGEAQENNQRAERAKGAVDRLCFHVAMYALADRMLMPGLKHQAQIKFEEEVTGFMEWTTFSRAVIEIYMATPKSDRGMRDLVVAIAMANELGLGLNLDDIPGTFEDEFLFAVPLFAFDLLFAIKEQNEAQERMFKRHRPSKESASWAGLKVTAP